MRAAGSEPGRVQRGPQVRLSMMTVAEATPGLTEVNSACPASPETLPGVGDGQSAGIAREWICGHLLGGEDRLRRVMIFPQ